MTRHSPAPSSRRQRGQSTIEYIVVLLVAVVVLVAGDDPPIQKLAGAIREYYTDYSFAISLSSMPDCVSEIQASTSVGELTVTGDTCLTMDSMSAADLTFNINPTGQP
jgi:hypothetical protein